MDYGYNVKYVFLGTGLSKELTVKRFGKNVYVNTNSTWIDTSPITIGDRTLIGPNCSFYSGNHPTDPRVRNGTNGPENGAPITIGADCWLGGSVTVVPGVTIGRGCTIGAGSVVTKDIPPFMVAAGNPARVLKPVRQVPAEELPPGYTPPADIPVSE
jgi:acetyltransferase-like isoleucine patch superfamily enzyme